MAQIAEEVMNKILMEIFAVGKWNGMMFTAEDLRGIVDSFNKLADKHKVYLKLGHNEEQPLTDGQPALGWVESLIVKGDKLLAEVVNIPDIVKHAIEKKLYRNVSIELDMDVTHMGNHYPNVLSAVALLGADTPAVSTLKDLTHYMSQGAAFSAGRRAVFTAIAGQSQTKEYKMTLEELTQKVAELTASTATFTTENAKLKAENAELAGKVAKFAADEKAKQEADAKAATAAKRTQVTTILEDGVKSEGITPAQRDNFTKVLRLDDDIAVNALDLESVKAMIPAGKKQFSREQGKQGDNGGTQFATVAHEVDAGVKDILAKKEAKTYGEAQALLFTRNPKLGREYVDFNDKE